MNQHKLSIITPVYNRADCIGRCIESVLPQVSNGFKIEHIIVDDGSKDNTAEIVSSYVEKHTHIKAIYFDRNKGTNAARNAAIREASGDHCIILDSDDYFTPDAIEVISETIKSNPDFNYFMFTRDDRTEEFDGLYGKEATVKFNYADALTRKVNGDYIHVIPSGILKKYPFDEYLKIYESLILQQVYREVGKMLFLNHTIVIAERNRTDSVTWLTLRTNEHSIKRSLAAALKEIELFGDDYLSIGHWKNLDPFYFQVADNAILLGDYKLAQNNIRQMKTGMKKLALQLINTFRLGNTYRFALNCYLKAKYKIILS